MSNEPIPPASSSGLTSLTSRFRPGQLVRHRRYGYRGVVVAFDLQCVADDQWYYANPTQPARSQPWYHVLVHGTDQTTYAAQENLRPDATGLPVEHPLVDHFFTRFAGDHYVRNDEPWPT